MPPWGHSSMHVNPQKNPLSAAPRGGSVGGEAAREAEQKARALEAENEALRREKLRVLERMEEERRLFLARQEEVVRTKRSEELTVRKAEELTRNLQSHFQAELLKSRRCVCVCSCACGVVIVYCVSCDCDCGCVVVWLWWPLCRGVTLAGLD